jgi:hypothetical protein
MKDEHNILRIVLDAGRSPMNPKLWLCRLSCDHEIWQRATRKPKRVYCGLCRVAQLKADGTLK